MVLWCIAVCVGVFLMSVVVIAVPFVAEASYQIEEGKKRFEIVLWWLKPYFFRLQIVPWHGGGGACFMLRYFGIRRKQTGHKGGEAIVRREEPVCRSEEQRMSLAAEEHIDKNDAKPPAPPEGSVDIGEEKCAPPRARQRSGYSARVERRYLQQKRRIHMLWRLALQTGLRRRIVAWLLRVMSTIGGLIHFDAFRLHVKAHLADPALLGIAYGCYQGVRGALMANEDDPIDLHFEPVFVHDHLTVDARFRMSTSLLRVFWLVLVATVTFPFLSLGVAWCREVLSSGKKSRRAGSEGDKNMR